MVLIFQHTYLPISIWKLAVTGNVGSRVAPSFSHSWGSISNFGVNWRWICWHPYIQSMSALLYLGNSTSLWEPCGLMLLTILGHSGELCVSSLQYWFPLVLSSVQVFSRTCHRSIQTSFLVAPCWMEATWVLTVLNMLVDIPHCCCLLYKMLSWMFQ